MTEHLTAQTQQLGFNHAAHKRAGLRPIALVLMLATMLAGIGSRGAAATAMAQSLACPCSMWDAGVHPDTSAFDDAQPVEVGVKFRADLDGYITTLRFYKGTEDPGTYIANLWSASGKLLGSGLTTDERHIGWVEVPLAAPVAITARTTYVASYHTSIGRYAATSNFFATAPAGHGPLHALVDGDDGGNGVFAYGPSAFPTESFNATSYWVDAVFNTSAVDTIPPSVRATTPAVAAKDVTTGTKVTATFAEDVLASSVALTLTDAQNAAVTASMQYDAVTRTATLTPSESLAEGATYTVRVSGATDTAGNKMPAAFTWSFVTLGNLVAAQAGPPDQPAVTGIEPLSVSITSDLGPNGLYYIGQLATVCVTVNRWAFVRIYHQRAGGEAAVLFPIDGAGGDGRLTGRYCVYEIIGPIITGDQAWVVEARDIDGNVASSSIPFVLVDYVQ